MRIAKPVLACCLAAVAAGAWAEQDLERCRRDVDATVQVLELHARQSGVEQRLRDLSVKQIRDIEKSDGSCAAWREIQRRKSHT